MPRTQVTPGVPAIATAVTPCTARPDPDGIIDIGGRGSAAINNLGELMSTLKQQLKSDVVAHMKAGNKIALTTVRNVLGEIETREKGGKNPVEFDDAQVITLLQKEAAKRHDTAGIYSEAGESDRAAAELAEAEVIEAYLPKALNAEEAAAIVDRIISGLEAEQGELSMRQMGLAMKPITAEIAGRFDGKAVSEMVRKRLQ